MKKKEGGGGACYGSDMNFHVQTREAKQSPTCCKKAGGTEQQAGGMGRGALSKLAGWFLVRNLVFFLNLSLWLDNALKIPADAKFCHHNKY